jgi:tetratricopeptide (TPR) repeat protein
LPVRVDIEEFEKYWNEAQKSGIPDQCLKLYKSAISLYRGPFLQDMAGEGWVTPLSEYYQHIYTECVLRAARIYRKSNDYQNIVMLCSQAVLKNPYEENIYECILKAFIRLNRKEKALKCFNVLSQKFTEDLGIELSPNINSLYGEILKLETDSKQNIREIACELKESSYDKGALYCDFEVFKSIFRLKLRERQKEHLMLCFITLAPKLPVKPGNNERSLTSTADTLIMNLRKGDVVSKISRRQYIVMISNKRDTLRNDNEAAAYDYAGKVFKRLVSQLKSAEGSEDWSVRFEIYEGLAETDKTISCITAEF